MELSDALFLLLSLIISALCPFILKHIRKKNETGVNATKDMAGEKKRILVPGTTGWPILGETLDYYSKIRGGNLEKFVVDRMTKYSSKIFRTSLLGQPMVVFCGPEGNKFLFANERKLVQVWWPSALNKIFPKTDSKPSHEHSNKLRNMLQVIFKIDRLRHYVGTMDEVMKRHLETHWINRKEIIVGHMAKKFLTTLACNMFLGIDDPGKVDMFVKEMERMEGGIFTMPINFPGTAFHRALKSSNFLRKEVEERVKQRRSEISLSDPSSGKDFMFYLIRERDDNGEPFRDEDIASHLVGLLVASFTTMHSAITSTMKYLAELPDIYDSVLGEQKEVLAAKERDELLTLERLRKMKYTWNVVCEVFRIVSSGAGSFREAITDFNYDGYTIPKGSKIHWIFHSTQKNEKYFPKPNEFDPSRFQGNGPTPFTFVPFGGGPRICPGHEYAKLAILVFLHNVVTNFRWEMKIPNERMIYYPATRPQKHLPVRLQKIVGDY